MPARSTSSASRNDPCPCGSGKKYKKCCMGSADPPGPPGANGAGAADPAHLLEQATQHHREGRVEMAIELYRQITARRPKDAIAHFYLGQALGQLDQREEAVDVLKRAIALNPKRALYHSNLAAVLLKSGRAEESVQAARRAIAIDPNDAVPHCTLAGCYERLNRLDEAIDHVERALALDPDDADSQLVLAGLQRRDGRHEEARALLEAFLRRDEAPEYRYQAWKELAVVLDRLGVYDEAFAALTEGGVERGRTAEAARVDHDHAWRRIDMYRDGLTPELLSRWTPQDFGTPYATPAFLIGFPRSGTTMTEQVMAAHPDVTTSDEKPMIRHVKEAMRAMFDQGEDIPAMLARLDRDQIVRLRAIYWERAEELMGASLAGRVFVDKLPLHLIDLGLINVLFPEARVIVALRDPRDVCLSCFTQRFGLNGAMVNFLWWDRTAAFYEKVMDHWLRLREMITVSYIEIRYEDTVTNLEQESRRILEHLGVGWDERVLEFYKSARERFISTPSYAAVTEPVHTRAIGRWKNYRSHYEPVRAHLDRFVEAFGYGERD